MQQSRQITQRDPLGKWINPKLSRHYVVMSQYLTDDEIRSYLMIPGYEKSLDDPGKMASFIKVHEFLKTPAAKASEARTIASFDERYANYPLKVLGLQPGASKQEIRNAYRRLARKAHPDHGGSEPEMKRINAAYVTLCPKAKAL